MPLRQYRVIDQTRLLKRQFGGAGGEQRHAAHGANTLAGIVCRKGEILDGGGQQRLQTGILLPLRHGAHGIFVAEQPL